jgi:hypothetical protein
MCAFMLKLKGLGLVVGWLSHSCWHFVPLGFACLLFFAAGGTLGEAARDARLRAPAAAQHDMGILTHSLTDSRALALALTDS